MIVELGHFALILALCVAIIQSIFPIMGAARGEPGWMELAQPSARLQLVFIGIAFAVLTYAFISNDFTVAYVANNSNSTLPLMYRISAVWGAHEGSLLLWSLILGIWTVAVTFFSHSLSVPFRARVIGVMGLVSTGFLLFMLFTSNPFERYFPAPADGADLNPLLQDPGLIIHPPVLYTGYVGFSVVFAFAIAALLGGRLDSAWARWSRPWTTTAWVFLTLGIALGSWWAYYELGWGGWWFWDPVENASFMPWLAGTALIHSLAATEKRNVFKNWTVLLAISTFALSLLGTFLVRSGVLTSVHAFASDPGRGLFILSLLGVTVGGSLILYAWRAPGIVKGTGFSLVSRETFLLTNSVLLTLAMGTILLGTIYPLIAEALGLGKLSVGAPYFNAVFVPLMIPVTIAMGFGILTRWRVDRIERLWRQLWIVVLGSTVIGVLLIAMLINPIKLQAILGVSLASWIVWSTLLAIRFRLRHKTQTRSVMHTMSSSFVGMCFAHIGLAITIIGIAITSNYSTEIHKRMGPGDKVELAGYSFVLKSIDKRQGQNYLADEAVVQVYKDTEEVTVLRSQKRIYPVRNMPMTEAGIDADLFRDIYVSLGERLDNTDWSMRFYHRPFVRWIWLGAIFMALGGVLAATDRRYRIKSAIRTEQIQGQDIPINIATADT